MLKNERWQAVPGISGVEIYPLIIKPNINSSNAFIIATDENILLIDTGASPEQIGQIKTVIRQLLDSQERPVLIFLTHCHADHCWQAFSDPELVQMAKVRIAVQEEGVEPLEEKDARRTLADIQRKVLYDARIDFVLLSGQDKNNPAEKLVNLGDGIKLQTLVEKINTGNDKDLYRQTIKIGPQAALEIYPMPGHSPDSICIRIGELLFAGDFFFAVNFLIAGAVGWSQTDMMDSIRHMLWLAENQTINCFCTGHGLPISRQAAIENMYSMLTKAAELANLNELNCEHMNDTSQYALELLQELNDTLAIIAGRLFYVVYYLDYLDESARSEEYKRVIDFARIDELLEEYDDFAGLFAAGEIAYPTLIMKAAQLTGKIDKIFAHKGADGVIDKYLLRRVQNSFSDFMQIAGGMPIEYISEEIDLNLLLEELLVQITSVPYNDDIIDLLDNEDRYLDALVSRIAFQPVFRQVCFDMQAEPNLPGIKIPKDRFCNTLLGVLEEIAALDIKEICLLSARANMGAIIRISCPKGIPGDVLNEKKLHLYQRKFSELGGDLAVEKDQDGIAFRLKLSGQNGEYSL